MNNMYGMPGFESYNMMNFPYPNMGYQSMNTPCQNNVESKIKQMEKQIDNLQNRVSRLEENMYPKAIDYSNTTYQSMM